MEEMKVASLAIGDKLDGNVYCLKSLSRGSEWCKATLADKTGEINAVLSATRFQPEMRDLVGGAVEVNAVVLNGENMTPYVKVKSIKPAKEGSFKPSDLFDGLDDAHVSQYVGIIKELTARIPDGSFRGLAQCILTDGVLAQLAVMPASLSGHGHYRGGALAAAAMVTKFVTQSGTQYTKYGNGLYSRGFDWSVVMAASLIHTVGVVDYYTDQPWHKTPIGLERGYMSLLQSRIERTVAETGLAISQEKIAKLLNVLGSSVPMKTGVKATSSEGVLFRHCLILYEELDIIDAGMASFDGDGGEGCFYDPRARRVVSVYEEGGQPA